MKKTIAFIMAITLLFTMVACAKTEDEQNENTKVNNVVTIGEIEGTAIKGTLPQKVETIDDFDATAYKVAKQELMSSYYGPQWYSNMLFAEEKVFFIHHLLDENGNVIIADDGYTEKQGLYYTNGQDIYLIKEDVYNICGVGEGGIYLICEDPTVALYEPTTYSSDIKQTSLIYFDPKTGEETVIAHGAQSAVVIDDFIYYSIAIENTLPPREEDIAWENEILIEKSFLRNWKLQLVKYNINTEDTQDLFIDNLNEYEKFAGKTVKPVDYAFDVILSHDVEKDVLKAHFAYPIEAGGYYDRDVCISLENDIIVSDTEETGREEDGRYAKEEQYYTIKALFWANVHDNMKQEIEIELDNDEALKVNAEYLLKHDMYNVLIEEIILPDNEKTYVLLQYFVWTELEAEDERLVEGKLDLYEWVSSESGIEGIQKTASITLVRLSIGYQDYIISQAGDYLFIQTKAPCYMVIININTNEIMVLGTDETQVLLPH